MSFLSTDRIVGATTLVLNYLASGLHSTRVFQQPLGCDTYECRPELSRHWGQYSPWFSVPSEISASTPPECKVTMVQMLSRHGDRFPTAHSTKKYARLIDTIHCNVNRDSYGTDYSFIRDYNYTLGADDLTWFGENQLVESGRLFFERYPDLSTQSDPFVRASGQERVVQSARNWTQGFYQARTSGQTEDQPDDHLFQWHQSAGPSDEEHEDKHKQCQEWPDKFLVICESKKSNNTLSHSKCPAFEDRRKKAATASAKSKWASVFVPPIQKRVNENLPGADLSLEDVIHLMDLCPFNTVASRSGKLSEFCDLFTPLEWKQYNYFYTLDKYYGYGAGSEHGPANGIGYTHELIARLTGKPVEDNTSTNHTLDSHNSTFPLNMPLYADFSHDNDMMMIYFAMNLYSTTRPPSTTQMETLEETKHFSAAYTVPFAARVYFEKLECGPSRKEMVRVLMNDRVLPLESCKGDKYGRCTLTNFVASLKKGVQNAHWERCFE